MSKGDGNKEDEVQNEEVTQPVAPEVAAPPIAAVPNAQLVGPMPEMQVKDHPQSSSMMRLGSDPRAALPNQCSVPEYQLCVCRQQRRLVTQQLSRPNTNPEGRCSSGTRGYSH